MSGKELGVKIGEHLRDVEVGDECNLEVVADEMTTIYEFAVRDDGVRLLAIAFCRHGKSNPKEATIEG